MGFVSQPSTSFLEKFGNPQVPSVIALIPPSGENDNQFQVLILIIFIINFIFLFNFFISL